jgi:5-methylcytosine-specific restriction endonuclease McrA
MKTCSRCKAELPATTEFFHRKASSRDGLGYCKSCGRKRRARYRAEHLEEVKAANRQWLQDNPEKVESYRQRYVAEGRMARLARTWRRRNMDRIRKTQAAYRVGKEAYIADLFRRWRSANEERYAELIRRRKARVRGAKLGAIAPLTATEWVDNKDYFAHRCGYCPEAGPRVNLAQEHMTPVSRGGTHDLENVIPACKRCNSRKRDKTLLEWLMAA